MTAELDVYIATSGPYRLGFVSTQIASTAPCPSFDSSQVERPGILGAHDGMVVVHPAWLWGQAAMEQAPQQLLVVRTGVCALAVDSCRLQRVVIDPPPAAMAGSGVVFGIARTAEGMTPVVDLACVPLV